jgi:hypothetical protein
MDETVERFAYRCTPMTVANATGWEVLSPYYIEAEWDGGTTRNSITIKAKGQAEEVRRFVCSHFGQGILTFHPGYVFKTSPGWALWVRGCPNSSKPGLMPLEGLVETDWLPFTFTMNWRFTRPGKVVFEEGEPFCFVTLTPHGIIDQVSPMLADLAAEEAAQGAYEEWRVSRQDFNKGLADPESEQTRQGWQKRYLTGLGAPPSTVHKVKRRLKVPRECDGDGRDCRGGDQ